MDPGDAATEIVSAAASRLCLDMRFLSRAVLSLRTVVEPGEGKPCCDGRTVTFRRDTVISSFRNEPNSVTRDIAHCVLHCVLGHGSPGNPPETDLAEDMLVEYVLDCLDTPHTSVPGRDDRMFACERQFAKAGAPSADLLSQVVRDTSPWQLESHRKMFVRDDHSRRGALDDSVWRELSQQVMAEVEGFVRDDDGRTGALMSILRIRNRRRYDYRSFLRKFMTSRTVVRESQTEFDPIYYTYGLSVYGNMPLIDSLEQSDSGRVEEFVIAIDTSGSTMRGPVVRFLEEAFDVLRQTHAGRGANLHVIQCDDMVRSDDVVTCEGDLRRLVSGFELRGGGGTDFRPVFDYVDRMVEEGGFRDLRGLMYFTDGFGTYPTRRPRYDTAFVFCDDRYRDHEVPPWAMRIVVRTEDIMGPAQTPNTQ